MAETSQQHTNRIENIPIEKRHNWQPGESGNPNGRPANKNSITWWYRKLLAEDDGKPAEDIASKAIEKAKEGSIQHIQEVTDRVDGKIADTHIIGGHLLVSTPETLELALQARQELISGERKLLEQYGSDTIEGEIVREEPL